MGRRVINCIVKDEYVQGAGVMVGAAGSHDDVVLRLEFEEMWEGTTKTITWLDALGGNPTLTTLTASLLETGTTNVYLVPIPGEPKAYPGKMTMTIKGVTVSGTTEITATLSVAAWFTVAESFWDADAQESADVTPTQAEQLQAEIDDVLEDISNIQVHAADAEAWAVGQRDGQPVTEGDDTWHNNAKYYAQQADDDASSASADALKAEGFAVGEQNGTPVISGTYYHNNAKYYKEQADTSASNAATSESNALGYKNDAGDSATAAAGSASDAKDYRDTAYGYMGNAAGSAAEALASEGLAQGYATDAGSAKTAAETAQGKAEDAQAAAETAQGKAEDAQEAAEAAQTAAETAQGLAESAQTAAETAQGKAEDAQTAAEIAQTAAETAQAAAETAAEEAEEIVAVTLAAFPTDSASGNPATFTDGADGIPVKSLVATIPYMPYEIKPGWYLDERTNTYRPTYSATISTRTIIFKAKPSTAYTITSGIPGTMRAIATTDYPVLGTGYSNRVREEDDVNPVSVEITTTALQTWITVQFFVEDDVTEHSATIEAALAGWSTSPVLSFGGLTITANGEAVTADWSAQGEIYGGTVDFTNGIVTGTVDSTGAELDPPVVYTIDPIPVNSAYGSNSISSEVGSVAVEYRADPEMYYDSVYAPIDSPALSGTPTAPTPADGDDSTKIATTAFVSKAAYDAVVASMITDTASGPIATFPDGADGIPVKSLTAQITPVQNLNGYDHPWPGGGGINLFNKDAITGGKWLNTDTGAIENATGAYSISDYIPIKAGVTYTHSSSGSTRCWTYDSDKTPIARIQTNTFTATADGYFIFTIHTPSYDINTIMFVAGSAVPGTYSPYSNLCPITGWTGAEIVRTGKNLFDYEAVTPTSSVELTITRNNNAYSMVIGGSGNKVIRFNCGALIAGQYTLSVGRAVDKDGVSTNVYWTKDGVTQATLPASFTADGVSEYGFLFFGSNENGPYTIADVQLERGSTASDYAPFIGTTYTVPFGQTVYGGDAEFLGGGKWRVTPIPGYIDSYAGETLVGPYISSEAAPDTTPVTGSQVFDYGATPLTPVIVDGPDPATLYGTNNVWADTGDVALTYRADTALYINKILGA